MSGGRLREARAALLHRFHDPVMRDGVDVAYCIDGECHGVIYVVDGVEEVRRTHSERCHVAPYLEALAADEHDSLDAAIAAVEALPVTTQGYAYLDRAAVLAALREAQP